VRRKLSLHFRHRFKNWFTKGREKEEKRRSSSPKLDSWRKGILPYGKIQDGEWQGVPLVLFS
jgi:hypothetical protein